MKVAVFGGSFNPLHIGHAMLADTIVKEYGYDKVLFVPTSTPPHKIISGNVTPVQRAEMIQRFCEEEGDGHFELETCEIDRGGISYTVDTLSFLQKKYEGKLEGKLAFIMGDEVAAEFSKWKNPEKIIEVADLIITRRYADWASLEKSTYKNTATLNYNSEYNKNFNINDFQYECVYIDKPILPVSSTEIRQRICENRSFKYLVPKSVFEYILEKGLYK